MKTIAALFMSFVAVLATCKGQTLSQTFETGEDTSNWGANWSGPAGFTQSATAFLDSSLGGTQAGQGTNGSGQEAFRSYANNTVGFDFTTQSYQLSMYVGIGLNDTDPPASGSFYIANGFFGTNNAGELRLESVGEGPLTWEAQNGSGTWVSLGIVCTPGTPYYVQLNVNPTNNTYSALVSQVTTGGSVVSSGSAANLSFDQNTINNHGNSQLLFHIEGSAGNVGFAVDDINISSIPEPSTTWLMIGGIPLLAWMCRKRARRGHCS